MPSFSKSSKEKLATCHQDLQRLFNEVIKNYDCTIICGHRSKEEQDLAFKNGKSKLKWPDGKHNNNPSLACDVIFSPLNWNDKIKMYHFVGYVKGIADCLGIKIRCGADFNGDGNFHNDSFVDLVHFELV